jgi:hypothetical protein
MRAVAVLFLAASALRLSAQEFTITTLSRHVLTNEGVILLAKAGFDELFIIERIRTSRTRFDTSVDGLVALKQAGVSEDLIRVMALEDQHKDAVRMLYAAPDARTVRPVHIVLEKHWWGFRWRSVAAEPQ